MDDREKRQLIEELISEIQIYSERQPNGQWLKSIKFRLPIIEEDMNISLDNEQHVETVVLSSHKKADSYIHIDVEFGEGEGKIPVDSIAKRAEAYKPKEKVTYKMIKEYIEAKYGFKVHTAYIAEVSWSISENSLELAMPLCADSTAWVPLPPTGKDVPTT